MGYPILTPSSHNPFEAEAICSLLYHMSSLTGVTHVVSEDTDVLVYSAPLLRRITTSEVGAQERLKKKKGFEMSITDPEIVREGLGLSKTEFVDWCLLCGTDFTERVPL
jgi:5'-3' exonuclease